MAGGRLILILTCGRRLIDKGGAMMKNKCDHRNWVAAGYPCEINNRQDIRIQSAYEAFCFDCGNFINLLTREIVNDKGLVAGAKS